MRYGDRYSERGKRRSGGTGNVVFCDDPNLERIVAIKFLQRPDRDKRRMYDEIAALQRIRSKHVVQIYDIVLVQPGNQIGIVQEYIPGEDLRNFSKTAPNSDQYLRLLYQIAGGLADIHEQGLIHRDVKPNNMKFDQEKLVKLFDFDLAREDGDKAKTVGFHGTLGFAAPELFTFGTVAFTQAVDVYAFGATALYCAEGKLPDELMENPPDPEAWEFGGGFSGLSVGVPKPVATILDACLSTDPDARPKMIDVRKTIADQLLFGRHRALLVHVNRGATAILDLKRTPARVSRTDVGTIAIGYDGLKFVVSTADGDVFVNNERLSVGTQIHGSCVLTIGGPHLGTKRDFITLDIAQPEVVL